MDGNKQAQVEPSQKHVHTENHTLQRSSEATTETEQMNLITSHIGVCGRRPAAAVTQPRTICALHTIISTHLFR